MPTGLNSKIVNDELMGPVHRHVAKGASEGADEPPFFSDQKKKIDGSSVFRYDHACTAVGLRIHGPEVAEPNLESIAL